MDLYTNVPGKGEDGGNETSLRFASSPGTNVGAKIAYLRKEALLDRNSGCARNVGMKTMPVWFSSESMMNERESGPKYSVLRIRFLHSVQTIHVRGHSVHSCVVLQIILVVSIHRL